MKPRKTPPRRAPRAPTPPTPPTTIQVDNPGENWPTDPYTAGAGLDRPLTSEERNSEVYKAAYRAEYDEALKKAIEVRARRDAQIAAELDALDVFVLTKGNR